MKFQFFMLTLGLSLLFSAGTVFGQSGCDNILQTEDNNKTHGVIFKGGESFGQSFQVDASCSGGTTLNTLELWTQGNSTANMTLKIYDNANGPLSGQTEIYSQTNIAIPPGNRGTVRTIELTNPPTLVNGGWYRIKMEVTDGNVLVTRSDNNAAMAGHMYLNNDLPDTGKDLRIRFGSSQSCGGIKITRVPAANGADYSVEVDATNYNHQVNAPGALYQSISLEDGNCVSCQNIFLNNGPRIKTWNITSTGSNTKLVFQAAVGGCAGTTLHLN